MKGARSPLSYGWGSPSALSSGTLGKAAVKGTVHETFCHCGLLTTPFPWPTLRKIYLYSSHFFHVELAAGVKFYLVDYEAWFSLMSALRAIIH